MLLDLVKKRRSIRKFTDEPVTNEDIKKIIEVDLHAPTAKNLNPVRYIVVRDKDRLKELSKFKKVGAHFIDGASVAIAIVTDTEISPVTNHQDASIAASFIMLQVAEMGLGATWANVTTSVNADGRAAKDVLREFFNLDNKFDVECIMAIGHPAEQKSEKIAFNYDENVFEDLDDIK